MNNLQGGASGRTVGLGWLWFSMFHHTAQLLSHIGQFLNSPSRNRQRVEEPKSKLTKPYCLTRCPSLYFWVKSLTSILFVIQVYRGLLQDTRLGRVIPLVLREFRLQNDDVPLPQESDRGETGGGGKYGRRLDLRITKNFVYSDTGGDIHGIGLVLLRLEHAEHFPAPHLLTSQRCRVELLNF